MKPPRVGDDDRGFTLVEFMVAAALSMVLLTALAAVLVATMRTTSHGTSQSEAVDTAREVLNQVQRDLRASTQLSMACDPALGLAPGDCALIMVQFTGAQPPQEFNVRYRHEAGALYRDIDDDPANPNAWPTRRLLTEDLRNGTVPVFDCELEQGLARVGVTLLVGPTPDTTYEFGTVVSPRNRYIPTSC